MAACATLIHMRQVRVLVLVAVLAALVACSGAVRPAGAGRQPRARLRLARQPAPDVRARGLDRAGEPLVRGPHRAPRQRRRHDLAVPQPPCRELRLGHQQLVGHAPVAAQLPGHGVRQHRRRHERAARRPSARSDDGPCSSRSPRTAAAGGCWPSRCPVTAGEQTPARTSCGTTRPRTSRRSRRTAVGSTARWAFTTGGRLADLVRDGTAADLPAGRAEPVPQHPRLRHRHRRRLAVRGGPADRRRARLPGRPHRGRRDVGRGQGWVRRSELPRDRGPDVPPRHRRHLAEHAARGPGRRPGSTTTPCSRPPSGSSGIPTFLGHAGDRADHEHARQHSGSESSRAIAAAPDVLPASLANLLRVLPGMGDVATRRRIPARRPDPEVSMSTSSALPSARPGSPWPRCSVSRPCAA